MNASDTALHGQNTTTVSQLYMAFELGEESWKLSLGDGRRSPSRCTVAAGDTTAVLAAVANARARGHLGADAPVYSCYEAGRDGFWLHRWLAEQGIVNLVVDSASIEVNRRARRAKTDWLDSDKLLSMLMRYYAGGDTASALASGCPVILKAHNGHPGASGLMGRVIQQAVRDLGLHDEGVFSLVRGGGNAIGEALVDHPLIKGVTFTGSEAGGMALFRRAQQRPDPIPVFTEMTSVNPTFVLPAALAARGGTIGDGFTERMLVTVGQACLKPAILVAVDGPGYLELKNAMIPRVEAMQARTMLSPGINAAYRKNVERQGNAGAERIAAGGEPQGAWDGQSVLFEIDGARMLENPSLSEEVFGSAALLVRVKDVEQLIAIARQFRGQLSATMQIDPADHSLAARLLLILERRTGRIVVNAFAHPQEVSYASIHGGPFPATSDSRFTSVGMSAIERFLRPVSYQGFPGELLPEALQHDNPRGIWRLTDGELSKA